MSMTDSEKLDLILEKLTQHDIELSKIEQRTRSIELTLENEIRTNIMRVAEGHLDLSRKLNEAIRITSDIDAKLETLDIRMSYHDSEINKIKLVK